MVHRIGSLSRTYRHITRYREIIRVLVKHGFGDLVTRSNLERYVDRGRKLLPGQDDRKIASLSRWERIRMVLEELGPTFIKFGQIMSNRPDLVPQELIAELAKLQSDVPPFSDAEARDLIEEELGRLKKRTNRLKSELSPAKRELFEAVQKVRNGARAAFGLHDKRLADFGLNPNIRRGRPPKKKFGKQLGLGLLETGEQD